MIICESMLILALLLTLIYHCFNEYQEAQLIKNEKNRIEKRRKELELIQAIEQAKIDKYTTEAIEFLKHNCYADTIYKFGHFITRKAEKQSKKKVYYE